ncbi:MAG: hypothetical protein K6B74_05575 [Ruminococcus sp.]|nr:hypothetical protein [Ruminococcus sp.]
MSSDRRSHVDIEKKKLTVLQIVFSVISILVICGVLFCAADTYFTMQADEGTAEKYGELAAKLMTLHDRLMEELAGGDQERILALIGIWAGIALTGLLAGTADLLLSRLYLDKSVTSRFGFGVNPTMRFLPSITVTVYMLFRLVAERFDPTLRFVVDFSNFNIKGEGYTWEMWVTQGCYVLVFFACIFTIYETFANSGPFGMIIRLPLSVLSNGAVVMLLMLNSVCVIVIALMFALIKAVGVIISVTHPDHVIYYRE